MPQSWPKGTGYDYFAPFVRATLIAPDGKTRLPIWTNLGPDGAPNSEFRNVEAKTGIGSIPYLTKASVRITRGWVPNLSITLTPPYRDGLALLDSVFSEFAETQLELTMGYFSSDATQTLISSPTWRGVTKAPQVNIGFETSITINAIGTGGFRAMSQEVFNIPETKISRRELINKLLLAPDPLTSSSSPTPVTTVGSDPAALSRVNKAYTEAKLDIDYTEADEDPATRARLDDVASISGGYRYALDLAIQLLREAGCTFRFETKVSPDSSALVDTLIVKKNGMATDTPKAKFYAFDYPQGKVGPAAGAGGGGIYPILTASSSTGGAFATGHTFYAVGPDPNDSGAISQVALGPEVTSRTSNGVVVPNNDSGLLANGVSGWFGDPNAKGALDRMRWELQAYTGNMGIAMDITTLGCPDIFPEDVVKLHGLGNRFSGDDHNYCVVVVEHTIDSNGYMSKLKMINNALPSLSGGSRGATAAASGAANNTNTVVQGGGSTVKAKPTPGVK